MKRVIEGNTKVERERERRKWAKKDEEKGREGAEVERRRKAEMENQVAQRRRERRR